MEKRPTISEGTSAMGGTVVRHTELARLLLIFLSWLKYEYALGLADAIEPAKYST